MLEARGRIRDYRISGFFNAEFAETAEDYQ